MNSRGKTPHAPKPRFFYGWYMVAVSWFMLFIYGSVGIGIFFKPILDDFGWDRATLSLVQTVAMMVSAVLTPFLGRLIDRFGPRVMLFVGATFQTLAGVITGMAGALWHIYAGRLFAEVRAMSSTQVLVNRWFVKKRGRAQGIVATGMPIGVLVLAPVSQYLILSWGWRTTMLFWAGVIFIIMFSLTLLVRDNPEDKGYSPDGEPLRRATSADPSSSLDAPETKSRTETGSSLSEAVRVGSFWLLSGTQLICGIGCGFMMTHIVIFATDLGYSQMTGATFMSIQGGFNLVGVLLAGHLSDRVARNRVLSMTHFIRSLSFITVVICIVSGGGPLGMLYVAMALFGFGWFTSAPLSAGLVADLFGYRRMGTISGVVFSCHMLGTAIGVYGGGITFELTGSYYWFFLIQGVLELLAAVFAFAIKRRAIYRDNTGV